MLRYWSFFQILATYKTFNIPTILYIILLHSTVDSKYFLQNFWHFLSIMHTEWKYIKTLCSTEYIFHIHCPHTHSLTHNTCLSAHLAFSTSTRNSTWAKTLNQPGIFVCCQTHDNRHSLQDTATSFMIYTTSVVWSATGQIKKCSHYRPTWWVEV